MNENTSTEQSEVNAIWRKLAEVKTLQTQCAEFRKKLDASSEKLKALHEELVKAYPESTPFIDTVISTDDVPTVEETTTERKPRAERKSSTTVHHLTMRRVATTPIAFKDLLATLQKEAPTLTEDELKKDVEHFKANGRMKEPKKGVLVWVPREPQHKLGMGTVADS